MAKFKHKCMRCKKNYVVASSRQRYVLCYDCQKTELNVAVEDPIMKIMFDIPEEFYKENAFLRDIRVKYNMYQELSEKQVEAFKKTVCELKGEEYISAADKAKKLDSEGNEEPKQPNFVPPERDDDEEIEC